MSRRWIRVSCFVGAAALALQLLPWRPAAAFPSLSPLLSLLGALSARSLSATTLLGLPVLILSFLHSRWFCRFACPLGLAAETAGQLNPKARRRFARFPRLGRALLLLAIGAAAAGHPLFLWLDPLSLFNGFFAAWRAPVAAASLALAAGLPLVLALSWIAPQSWCHRICPLGALQDLLTSLRRLRPIRSPPAPPAPPSPFDLSRRTLLGVAAGAAAGWTLRRTSARPPLPIRPPGALPEDTFAGQCARCGACIRACPQGILRPDFGAAGWTGLLAPAIDYSRAHCFEFCNACSQVCPTGAIRRLPLPAKRSLAIGLAHVDRSQCIAWRDREYCMVCHEYCPYLAIEIVERDGVNCPVVLADRCRGCGACQVNCPALPTKAIVVRGTPQRPLPPMEDPLEAPPAARRNELFDPPSV